MHGRHSSCVLPRQDGGEGLSEAIKLWNYASLLELLQNTQTWWLKLWGFTFSPFQRLVGQDQGISCVSFSWGLFSWQGVTFTLCPHIVFFSVCLCASGISSSSKNSDPIDQDDLWHRLTLIVYLKAISPDIFILGARALRFHFEECSVIHNKMCVASSQVIATSNMCHRGTVDSLMLGVWNLSQEILSSTDPCGKCSESVNISALWTKLGVVHMMTKTDVQLPTWYVYLSWSSCCPSEEPELYK